MAPMQDVLNLGSEARMNVPGRGEGNWRWRCPGNVFSSSALDWMRDLTKTTSRLATREGQRKGKVFEAALPS